MLARLIVMIRERTRPQRRAHATPFGAIALANFPNGHVSVVRLFHAAGPCQPSDWSVSTRSEAPTHADCRRRDKAADSGRSASLPVADQFDAVLYFGTNAEDVRMQRSTDVCSRPGFLPERLRRITIMRRISGTTDVQRNPVIRSAGLRLARFQALAVRAHMRLGGSPLSPQRSGRRMTPRQQV